MLLRRVPCVMTPRVREPLRAKQVKSRLCLRLTEEHVRVLTKIICIYCKEVAGRQGKYRCSKWSLPRLDIAFTVSVFQQFICS